MVKKLKFILPPLLMLSTLILLYFVSLSLKTKFEAKTSSVKSQSTQDIPELKGLLSLNQATRLKAAKALAERVGPDAALEIANKSGMPYTGEGHLAVHEIGFVAYKKFGVNAILHCKDYYLYACYHGAIIEAATDQGTDQIKKMTDVCKTFAPRFFQCVHAAGHAILAMWNYDLPQALLTCDGLYEQETQFPDTLTSCHNGAFMENLFGVHDATAGKTPKRLWLENDDPFYPCSAFGEKYQKGCWLNQGARIYQMQKGDFVKSAEICNSAETKNYQDWCFDNLARQIHPLTESSIDKVWSLCKELGQDRLEGCVMINAVSYYSVGDRRLGIDVCNTMTGHAKDVCLEPIINYIAIDNISAWDKRTLCQRIIGNDQGICIQKI